MSKDTQSGQKRKDHGQPWSCFRSPRQLLYHSNLYAKDSASSFKISAVGVPTKASTTSIKGRHPLRRLGHVICAESLALQQYKPRLLRRPRNEPVHCVFLTSMWVFEMIPFLFESICVGLFTYNHIQFSRLRMGVI